MQPEYKEEHSMAQALSQSCPPTGKNLIPDHLNTAPDYFCTWQVQLYRCNDAGPQGQRDCLTEQSIFGHEKGEGWARLHPEARQDLIFLMDDSWDVPIGALKDQSPEYGSQLLAQDKFPSFVTPGRCNETAMRKLNDAIRSYGWRGMGGWICAQQAPRFQDADPGRYWEERLRWSENAGWLYWKIDWGMECHSYAFRRMLTEMRYRYAPHLRMEQAMINELIPYADTFRTYDVFTLMGIPCTLEKLNVDLRYDAAPGYLGLINCMDEVYIAAALGCAIDVTRHGMVGPLPDGRPDSSFPDLHRRLKYRMDEVTRTVRWHRIAPPFAVNGRETAISGERLEDCWQVEDYTQEIEGWWKFRNGDRISRSAPARFSRGLPLPRVTPDENGDVPYVVCARYPEGAISIGTMGRARERRFWTPRCHITLDAQHACCRSLPYDGFFGIFGEYASLTLLTPLAQEGKRVWAQDLLGTEAVDITDAVKLGNGEVYLSGQLIHQLGTQCAHSGDLSDPGLLIRLI